MPVKEQGVVEMGTIWIIGLSCISLTLAAFEFEFESFTPLAGNDPNYIDYGTLRVAKRGRNNFVLLGNFTLKTNLGSEATTYVNVTNERNVVIFSAAGILCEILSNDQLFMPDIRKYSNMPAAGTCPLPKGNYWLKPYQLPVEKANLAPPGHYVFIMLVYVNGRIVGGQTVKVCLSHKEV